MCCGERRLSAFIRRRRFALSVNAVETEWLIVNAVEEGRGIYENIRKTLRCAPPERTQGSIQITGRSPVGHPKPEGAALVADASRILRLDT